MIGPHVRPEGLIPTIRHVMVRIKVHNVVVMSAGIAFYGVLALVPTLVALISIYALITDPNEIANQIEQLGDHMDDNSAALLSQELNNVVRSASGSTGIATLTGSILVALFSASGAVQKLMLSVTMAYATIERRKGWQVRALAYLFTAGAIVGVALIVFILGALPPLMSEIGLSNVTRWIINIARIPLLAAVFAGALTILYRYGPHRQRDTPWKNPGAVVGTLAFMLFAGAFSFYVSVAGGLPASYGVLGSIAALIIFFQLCALSVILGAEVNATYEGEDLDPTDQAEHREAFVPTVTVAPVRLPAALLGVAALFLLGRGSSKN